MTEFQRIPEAAMDTNARSRWTRSTHALAGMIGLITSCAPGAQPVETDVQLSAATATAVDHMALPTVITTDDPAGSGQTAATTGIDLSSDNPFFQTFGTNGRSCGTCHHADQGWGLTPVFARTLSASDPLFAFDGSDCLAPGQTNSNPTASSRALRGKGLIRVELPVLPTADYTLTSYTDPYGCPSSPMSTGVLRVYRRPLPTANLSFLTTIMSDGREPSLGQQANDATLGHAQATAPLTTSVDNAIVAFETGIFFAQLVSGRSPPIKLDFKGGRGGAVNLMSVPFFRGINDVVSAGFSPIIFTTYSEWESGDDAPHPYAASIGRGEALFNKKPITISGVNGLNGATLTDTSGNRVEVPTSFVGTCGTCHDTPNVGNHSVPLAIDIGVTGASPPNLDVSGLPTYTFTSKTTGQTIMLTDPGRGLITGKFADLGKTKGPILRGLSARAPYFHNGSAADLGAVVDFYNARFGIGFSVQEKDDLVAFLGAL
jgi:cytochrome c peroxidase